MGHREGRSVRINGQKYYVRVKENKLYQVVKVSKGRRSHHSTITTSWKLSIFSPQIEEHVSDALSAAVAKLEKRKNKKDEVRQSLDQSVNNVKEVYEE